MATYELQKTNVPSISLITDELILEALRKDFNENVELKSWKTEEFIHEGDNYSSVVTSIVATIVKDDKKFEKTYITKLNPLRPNSEITEFMEDLYNNEAKVLSIIAPKFNDEMKKFNLPALRLVNILSYCNEKRKEVLILEDLRSLGFERYRIKFRNRGMDLEHALLVVKELGRMHSISTFCYDELSKLGIYGSRDLTNPFCDKKCEAFQEVMRQITTSHCKCTIEILSKYPEYKKCANFLRAKLETILQMFFAYFKPAKSFKFNVFSHGDCWTNNLLFRYDENGNPIEIRHIDFQNSKYTSLVYDLNYFFYTSLNGETRKKYKKNILTAYYTEFLKVFFISGSTPPFTFEELQKEVDDYFFVGLASGILLIPIILCKDEGITVDLLGIDKDNVDEVLKASFNKMNQSNFDERFLSIFDDMLDIFFKEK